MRLIFKGFGRVFKSSKVGFLMPMDNISRVETLREGNIESVYLVRLGKQRVVGVPIYRNIKKSNCASFARRFANEHFLMEYNAKVDYGNGQGVRNPDAWDYRYFYKHLEIPDGDPKKIAKTIEEMHSQGKFVPGNIFGIFHPASDFTGISDMKGIITPHTHLAVFIGREEEGKIRFFFGEHLTDKVQVADLWEILYRGDKHRYVFYDEP